MTEIILSLIAAVLAITLHEAAHAYAALALGDDTARKAGRLSLNPLVHVDRVGTVLLPLGLLAGQLLLLGRVAFMFGWAKPVPVAAWRFANPRRGMMWVAAAGPAMNFALAWLGGLGFHLLASMPASTRVWGEDFLFAFILTNLVLGLFNLIPIPPLDGGRIAVGLLPEGAAMAWARAERYGIVAVILVLFVLPELAPHLGFRFDPVGAALNDLLPRALRFVLVLSGNHP